MNKNRNLLSAVSEQKNNIYSKNLHVYVFLAVMFVSAETFQALD